jgi:hypothetical protein
VKAAHSIFETSGALDGIDIVDGGLLSADQIVDSTPGFSNDDES